MKRIYLLLLVFSLCVTACGKNDAAESDGEKTEQPDDGGGDNPDNPDNPDDPDPDNPDPDTPEDPAPDEPVADFVFAVSDDAVIFDGQAAERLDFTVSAPTGYWRAERSAEWFDLTPDSGNGNAAVSVGASSSDISREGEIVLSLYEDADAAEPVARHVVRVFQDDGRRSDAPSFEVVNTTELLSGTAVTLQFAPQGETRIIDCRVSDAHGWHLFADRRNMADGHFSIDISGNRVYVTARPNTSGKAVDYTNAYLYLAATPDGARKSPVTVKFMQLATRYESMRGLIHANGGELASVHEALVDGSSVDAMKLGSGNYTGHYTSDVLCCEGDRKLVMFALGWKENKHGAATLYLRVNGGGSISPSSVSLKVNDGATGQAPFVIAPNVADRYVFELKDITPSSTISVSTNPDFSKESDDKTGRALLYGVQLR